MAAATITDEANRHQPKPNVIVHSESSSFTPFNAVFQLSPFSLPHQCETRKHQSRHDGAVRQGGKRCNDKIMTQGTFLMRALQHQRVVRWGVRRSLHLRSRGLKDPTAEVLADRQNRPTVKGSRDQHPISRGQHNPKASEVVAPEFQSTPRLSPRIQKGPA